MRTYLKDNFIHFNLQTSNIEMNNVVHPLSKSLARSADEQSFILRENLRLNQIYSNEAAYGPVDDD